MKKIKIIAHRGYAEKYPENTLLAFKQAFANGADGIECDIQKTKDGKYAVIHDTTLDRTVINKTGMVNALTLAELKTCSLGNDQTISELTELLSLIPEGCYFDLELKPETIMLDDCPVIYDIVLRYLKKRHLMVSSNEPHLLYYFRKKGITTGFIVENKCLKIGIMGTLKLITKLNPAYLNLPIELFKEIGEKSAWLLIRFMQLCGKKIAFWTINTKEDFQKIKNVAKLIITDRVEFIKTILKNVSTGIN